MSVPTGTAQVVITPAFFPNPGVFLKCLLAWLSFLACEYHCTEDKEQPLPMPMAEQALHSDCQPLSCLCSHHLHLMPSSLARVLSPWHRPCSGEFQSFLLYLETPPPTLVREFSPSKTRCQCHLLGKPSQTPQTQVPPPASPEPLCSSFWLPMLNPR